MNNVESINVGGCKIEKASKKMKCFQNAIRATVDVYKKSEGEILPRIWRVVLPELADSHAYLQIGEKVYSAGVTWFDEKYPELNFEDLKKKGLDVTTTVLVQTLLELGENFQGERMGFREAIQNFDSKNDEEMKILLEKMLAKSVTN